MKIKGLKQLNAKLSKLDKGITKEVDKTIKKYAYMIEKEAKSLAPVDTGYMRNSILVQFQSLSATISVNAEYAQYVEFGTSSQPPQPFFYLAFDSLKEQFVKELEEKIGDLL